jgi:hypothetical protein
VTRDELDKLSSHELHNLAVRRALHHVDVEFFWQLLRAIPAAEASEGHPAEAGRDITHLSVLLDDKASGVRRGRQAVALAVPAGMDKTTSLALNTCQRKGE